MSAPSTTSPAPQKRVRFRSAIVPISRNVSTPQSIHGSAERPPPNRSSIKPFGAQPTSVPMTYLPWSNHDNARDSASSSSEDEDGSKGDAQAAGRTGGLAQEIGERVLRICKAVYKAMFYV